MLSTAFIVIIICLILVIFRLFKKFSWIVLTVPFSAAFLLLGAGIVMRSVEIRFLALTSTFEGLLFFAAFIMLIAAVYLLIQRNSIQPAVLFILIIIVFCFMALASSPLLPSEAKAPVPALRSVWLLLHVSLAFVGESFFAFAFAFSIYILIQKSRGKKVDDRPVYLAIAAGYPVFILGGLIFGAVWAKFAWGRFWGWDPKENFALVTALVYTVYLHLRLVLRKNTRLTLWVSILGFLLTLFTFFGVNFLLPGLHSYN